MTLKALHYFELNYSRTEVEIYVSKFTNIPKLFKRLKKLKFKDQNEILKCDSRGFR